MKFDDVLQYLGEFGLYQKRVYFLLCVICIAHGMRMVVLVFILNLPEHRCAIPNYPNDTYDVMSLDHETALNMSIPAQDKCHIFKPGNYSYDVYNKPINASTEKCSHWVYDTSVFSSTVASQFDLVCEDATKRSHATMTFYGGFLIGVLVLGAVSDIIGRKLCVFLSLTLNVFLGIGLAFANSFITFAIINFLMGASTAGIFSSAFVIGIELVGPSKRTYTGMYIQLFFSSGVVGLAGLAYLIRDWQYLEITITAPLVLFYCMWCFIPESPRWQIQRGQYSKARATVEKIARVNGTKVPVNVLEDVIPSGECEERAMLNGDVEKDIQIGDPQKPMQNGVKEEEEKGRLIDLFKNRVLFVRTAIIFFNWTMVSLTFYGLNFNTGNLGAGSIFLNFFLAGLVEFPAHITTILTVDRLGRRVVHCGMMVTSGVACLACLIAIIYAPQEYQWATVALAMLGKFGAAGGFGTIYMYSTELYPTVIRSSALGASSSWARVGAMLAPYVAAQGTKTDGALGRGVPLLVYGCLILCAGLLSLFLPETLNRKLPETINDAKHFTSSTRKPDIPLPLSTSSDSAETKDTLVDKATVV